MKITKKKKLSVWEMDQSARMLLCLFSSLNEQYNEAVVAEVQRSCALPANSDDPMHCPFRFRHLCSCSPDRWSLVGLMTALLRTVERELDERWRICNPDRSYRLLMDRAYSTYVRSDISPRSSTQQGSLIWIVLLLITTVPRSSSWPE
jgi:hypothetical protein